MSQEGITKYPICPNCGQLMSLLLIEGGDNEIILKCYCGFSEEKNVNDYENIFVQKDDSKLLTTCNFHHKEYSRYCNECFLHLCPDCSKHMSHDTIDLNKEYNSIDINQYKNKQIDIFDTILSKSKEHYDKKMKKKYRIFENNLKAKKAIFEIMINSLIKNYYSICNIKNNSFQSILTIDSKDNLLEYYSNHILFSSTKPQLILSTPGSYVSEHYNNLYIQLLDNNYFLVGTDGGYIDLYLIQDKTNEIHLLKSFIHHTKSVTSFALLDKNTFVSTSFDTSLIFWKIEKDALVEIHKIENAHESEIRKVIKISEDKIATCSHDNLIKIWKTAPNYELVTTLNKHKYGITSIIKLSDQNVLVSASGMQEKLCIFWNFHDYETILTDVHCGFQNSLLEHDKKIFVGGKEIINVIDSITRRFIIRIKHPFFDVIVSIMPLEKDIMFFGTNTGKYVWFDTNTYKLNFYERQKKIREQEYTLEGQALRKINDNTFVSATGFDLLLWKYNLVK